MNAGNPQLIQKNGYGSVWAIDPADGTRRTAFVSLDFAKKIARDGVGRASEFREVVVPMLLKPFAIFQGLRLDHPEIDEDDWFCYVATPTAAYDYKRHVRREPWPGQVIIIPATSDWVVYNWYWVKSAPEDPRLPIDFQICYLKRLI